MLRRAGARLIPSLHKLSSPPHEISRLPGSLGDSQIFRHLVSSWEDTRSFCHIRLANGSVGNGFAASSFMANSPPVMDLWMDPFRNKPKTENHDGIRAKISPPWPATANSLQQMNASRLESYWNRSRAYSTTAEDEQKMGESASTSPPQRKSLEDFQHEEIVGPTVERDMSAVANELRQSLEDLRGSMKKFSAVIFAVGSLHLSWGAAMFLALESPFSHAVLTQVCMSGLVFFGLAYHLKQALKPMAFFTKLEERSRLRIITLSLQVTKSMAAFFQRGYGIGLVLSFTLALNLLSCVKVFFF